MSHAATLEAHNSQLLVVDLQVKLLPSIQDQEQTLAMSRQLIRTAGIFDLPVTVTQQYTKGLGETDPLINDALNDVTHTRFEKLTFCCSADEKVREHLAALDRRQVIVCGIVAHVCIQQTVLDLLRRGWDPFVCADAVASRHEFDYDLALLRMQQAGAIITTTESLLFELAHASDAPEFKRVLELVKEMDRDRAPPE